jgi:hypothetical protein
VTVVLCKYFRLGWSPMLLIVSVLALQSLKRILRTHKPYKIEQRLGLY